MRFFRNNRAPLPPSNVNYNLHVEYDAGAVDRLNRLTHKVLKKKRTTITLTVVIHIHQAPLIEEYQQLQQEWQHLVENNKDHEKEKVTATSAVCSPTSVLLSPDSTTTTDNNKNTPKTPPKKKNQVSFASYENNNNTNINSASAAAASSTSTSTSSNTTVAVAGSPIAATRFIRSTSGEPKVHMFVTIPLAATPNEVILKIEQDLLEHHKRKLRFPRDYYCLHPALEGHGCAIDRARSALYGDLAPLLNALGNFPFPPLALVPNNFAVKRSTIETKTEPELRMVIYRQRLVVEKNLGNMSKLFKETSNLAHSTYVTEWEEWKALKNYEIGHRIGLHSENLSQNEIRGRNEILHEWNLLAEVLQQYHEGIFMFYDDSSLEVRRGIVARQTMKIMMTRERTEIVQRVLCRERWEAFQIFVDEGWKELQFAKRCAFTEARIASGIVTANHNSSSSLILDDSVISGVSDNEDDVNSNNSSSLLPAKTAVELLRLRRKKAASESRERFIHFSSSPATNKTSSTLVVDTFRSVQPDLVNKSVICSDASAATQDW